MCYSNQIRLIGVDVNVSHLSTPSTLVFRWALILRLATSASTLISSSRCTFLSVCASRKTCGRSSSATSCSLWGFRSTWLGRSWRNALPFPWWCQAERLTTWYLTELLLFFFLFGLHLKPLKPGDHILLNCCYLSISSCMYFDKKKCVILSFTAVHIIVHVVAVMALD